MSTIDSPSGLWPASWGRGRLAGRRNKRAVAWTAGVVFASAVVLAIVFLGIIAVFNDGVASQLAETRGASMNLAPGTAASATRDEFHQQKVDAKIEELPAQF
jgi:hypothetical protein